MPSKKREKRAMMGLRGYLSNKENLNDNTWAICGNLRFK